MNDRLLNDPQAVLVSQTPVSEPVGWGTPSVPWRRQATAAMQIEAAKKAVIKPNDAVGWKEVRLP